MGTGSQEGEAETVLVMGMLLMSEMLLILMGLVGMVVVNILGVSVHMELMRLVVVKMSMMGIVLTCPPPSV